MDTSAKSNTHVVEIPQKEGGKCADGYAITKYMGNIYQNWPYATLQSKLQHKSKDLNTWNMFSDGTEYKLKNP